MHRRRKRWKFNSLDSRLLAVVLGRNTTSTKDDDDGFGEDRMGSRYFVETGVTGNNTLLTVRK